MKEKAFPQWAADAVRWTKEHFQRALGLGLAALGCVLAALARTGGGDPFQDFALGLLMGLGVPALPAVKIQKERALPPGGGGAIFLKIPGLLGTSPGVFTEKRDLPGIWENFP